MDISTNLYSQLSAQNAATEALNSKTSNMVNKNYDNATDDELMNACKQFESYFIEQVYKEMVKTIPEEEYSSQATGTLVDYYKEQMVQEMASATANQSGLGIAQPLYEQMKRNNEGAVTAAELAASDAAATAAGSGVSDAADTEASDEI